MNLRYSDNDKIRRLNLITKFIQTSIIKKNINVQLCKKIKSNKWFGVERRRKETWIKRKTIQTLTQVKQENWNTHSEWKYMFLIAGGVRKSFISQLKRVSNRSVNDYCVTLFFLIKSQFHCPYLPSMEYYTHSRRRNRCPWLLFETKSNTFIIQYKCEKLSTRIDMSALQIECVNCARKSKNVWASKRMSVCHIN